MSANLGQQIKQETIDGLFLSSPGADLIRKTLSQIGSAPQFKAVFGPFVAGKDQQRYADYQRMDWSVRQLPVMNLFESSTENKTSDEGFLNGTVTMQVFWPASFRRSDLARVPAAFKGAVQNFFSSHYVQEMLDELYSIQRPAKVYGLNEYGKQMNWMPAAEGLVETELVPVTVIEIPYRIDLRAWHRAMEFMGRTTLDPFEVTLADLTTIGVSVGTGGSVTGVGEYDGVTGTDGSQVDYVLNDSITVSNP